MKVTMAKAATTPEPVSLEEAQEEGASVVSEAIAAKRTHERKIIKRLDMGFYFSVVFETREARDIWLLENRMTLRDDDHLKPEDLEALKTPRR